MNKTKFLKKILYDDKKGRLENHEIQKSMIMLVLVIFIFGAASVCASDVNDTAIANEDDMAIELSQADSDERISAVKNDEIISEGNVGTFSELQINITEK